MAQLISLAIAVQNDRNDAIATRMGSNSLINVHDGTRPANGGPATLLLAQLTVPGAFAPASSGGILTVNAVTQDSSANNPGTATWFRGTTSAGTFVFDGWVGLSGADLNLTNIVIAAGGVVTIASFTVTDGSNYP